MCGCQILTVVPACLCHQRRSYYICFNTDHFTILCFYFSLHSVLLISFPATLLLNFQSYLYFSSLLPLPPIYSRSKAKSLADLTNITCSINVIFCLYCPLQMHIVHSYYIYILYNVWILNIWILNIQGYAWHLKYTNMRRPKAVFVTPLLRYTQWMFHQKSRQRTTA